MKNKIIYRSVTDRQIAGVCGGIAEYFEADSTIIRLIFVLFLFCGAGLLTYIVAWICIPKAVIKKETCHA